METKTKGQMILTNKRINHINLQNRDLSTTVLIIYLWWQNWHFQSPFLVLGTQKTDLAHEHYIIILIHAQKERWWWWYVDMLEYQRITIDQVLENPWFKKSYNPPKLIEDEDVSLEDVVAVFSESKVNVSHQIYWHFPSYISVVLTIKFVNFFLKVIGLVSDGYLHFLC